MAITDTFISKTTRLYEDTRTAQTAALAHGAGDTSTGASNLDKMNAELQDVTRIMTKNMEDLLWRGDSLDRESSDPVYRADWDVHFLF